MRCLILAFWIWTTVLGTINYEDGTITEDFENSQILSSNENLECGSSSCCEDTTVKTVNYIVISTMDGKLCALDVLNNGRTVWETNLETEPLMSGTLGKMQPMEADGNVFNLVPALDGALYMYSREERLLKPIPLNTEMLLQASLRIGHDAVAGGKTVSTTGVDPLTGEIRYHCTSLHCNKFRSDKHILSTLVFRRYTNRIQAVDSLTGAERWNLSVSEYDASLIVANTVGLPLSTQSGVKFLVQPPDGIITAVDSCGNKMWSRHIDSHIARTWQMEGAVLNEISLFENSNIHTLVDDPPTSGAVIQTESLFYLGTVNDEPFIMQSNVIKNELKRNSRNIEYGDGSQSPGKQLMIIRNSAFLVQEKTLDEILCSTYKKSFTARQTVNSEKSIHRHRALKTTHYQDLRDKHSTLPNSCSNTDSVFLIGGSDIRSATFEISESGDQGWFIMRPNDITQTPRVITEDYLKCSANKISIIHPLRFDPVSVQWYILGLIMIVSTGYVFLINYKTLRRKTSIDVRKQAANVIDATKTLTKLCSVSAGPSLDQAHISSLRKKTTSSHNNLSEPFQSKFLEDFQPVKLLGHGGFGVVFKAKNRLDEFLYAVKRISVENNERAIERVLREVRAMAQLDHPGIIRYYHTWIERPPIGWQEEERGNIPINCNKKHIKKALENKGKKSEFSIPKASIKVPGDQTDSDHISSRQLTTSNGNNSWFNDVVSRSETISSSSEDSNVEGDSLSGRADPNSDLEHSDSIIFYQNSRDGSRLSDSSEQFRNISLGKKMVVTSIDEDLLPCNNTTNFVYIYIQMQLCKEQTLHTWLSHHKQWSNRPIIKMKAWMVQLCSATNYIHQQGLIHRDIKPQNIFFASDQLLKIGDLGLVTKCVRLVDRPEGGDCNGLDVRMYTNNVGTRSYMSPEQLANLPYTFKVDVFSLGLIFCELVIPFQTFMERSKTLSDMQQGKLPETLCNMTDENNFISWLTNINPDNRPTCKDILESKYLSEEEK